MKNSESIIMSGIGVALWVWPEGKSAMLVRISIRGLESDPGLSMWASPVQSSQTGNGP